jgi:hypothetical protein
LFGAKLGKREGSNDLGLILNHQVNERHGLLWNSENPSHLFCARLVYEHLLEVQQISQACTYDKVLLDP